LQVLPDDSYCEQPPTRLRGDVAVVVSVLQALGYCVLPVPVREWQQLQPGEVEPYLRARLAAATS
jgi:hypothetical protein